jgi:hypothetical protein
MHIKIIPLPFAPFIIFLRYMNEIVSNVAYDNTIFDGTCYFFSVFLFI